MHDKLTYMNRLRSYEAVAKIVLEKSMPKTGATLYQLSYEALWERAKCQFNLYPSHVEDEIMYT